jgi:hypothetical protein
LRKRTRGLTRIETSRTARVCLRLFRWLRKPFRYTPGSPREPAKVEALGPASAEPANGLPPRPWSWSARRNPGSQVTITNPQPSGGPVSVQTGGGLLQGALLAAMLLAGGTAGGVALSSMLRPAASTVQPTNPDGGLTFAHCSAPTSARSSGLPPLRRGACPPAHP